MAEDDRAKTGTDRPAEPPASADQAAWDARRAHLDARLAEHRARYAAEEDRERRPGSMQGIAEGLKLASEFVAGIIVGAAIGYGIDHLAGTMPFGLIVFLMIGFAAGVRNVLRTVSPKPATLPETPAVADEPADNDKSRSEGA